MEFNKQNKEGEGGKARNRHLAIENKPMVTRGVGVGGMGKTSDGDKDVRL